MKYLQFCSAGSFAYLLSSVQQISFIFITCCVDMINLIAVFDVWMSVVISWIQVNWLAVKSQMVPGEFLRATDYKTIYLWPSPFWISLPPFSSDGVITLEI